MSRSLPVTVAALAGIAVMPAPAADAAAPAAKKPADTLSVSGSASRTSVITTRCPINNGMAISTETTTTTYTYAFQGQGGPRGEITTKGSHSYEMDRKVEGVSDAVKDAHTGPTERPLGDSAATFNSAVKRRKEGRGRKARRVVDLDLGPIAGGMQLEKTAALPGRGGKVEIPLDSVRPVKDLSAGGGCTSTEQITTSGSVTISRS